MSVSFGKKPPREVELDIEFNCPECTAGQSLSTTEPTPGFKIFRLKAKDAIIACPICGRKLFQILGFGDFKI